MHIETWPLATKSEANARGHWGRKADRASSQRGPARMLFEPRVRELGMRLPLVVKLTRVSPRELDDDNLRPALNAAPGIDVELPLAPLPPKQLALAATEAA